jgi:UDP-glucose 4-epimerase
MVSRVLVTGSSGFLGRTIVERLLANGYDVIGLDPAPPAVTGHRHLDDDLSDVARLRTHLAAERPTHIIHAGGVSGPMVLADHPDRVMAINVGGTLNLLLAALDTDVKTFVYCSSVSAVGDYYEATPIGDDYPLRPTSAYGCSKAAVDMVLRGLWGRVSLDLCSLRFTSIYGPGRQTSLIINDIIAGAAAACSVRVPASTDWPYIHVDDAADAAIAACFSDRRRQLVYFLAYPEQVALQDLAAAAGLARLEIDGSQPRASRGPIDIGPAVRDFGFAPKIDYREGIRRMIATRAADGR